MNLTITFRPVIIVSIHKLYIISIAQDHALPAVFSADICPIRVWKQQYMVRRKISYKSQTISLCRVPLMA